MKLEKDPGATTLVTLFKPRNLEELVRDYNLIGGNAQASLREQAPLREMDEASRCSWV
jgi:hypothetical protein